MGAMIAFLHNYPKERLNQEDDNGEEQDLRAEDISKDNEEANYEEEIDVESTNSGIEEETEEEVH